MPALPYDHRRFAGAARAALVFGFSLTAFVSGLNAEPAPAYPSDWSDLQREKVYGSLKDERTTLDALILEIENWDDHYSLGAFGLFRYTSYPAFTETRVWPFYNNTRARNDARSTGWFLPLYYYYESESESFWLTPLSLSKNDTTDSTSFFHFAYLYNHSRTGGATATRIWPLLFWSDDPERAAWSFGILPLAYYANSPGSTTLITPGFYRWTDYDDDANDAVAASDEPARSELLAGLLWLSEDRTDGSWSRHVLPVFFSGGRHAAPDHVDSLDGHDEVGENRAGEWWALTPLAYAAQGDDHFDLFTPLGMYSDSGDEISTVTTLLLPGYFHYRFRSVEPVAAHAPDGETRRADSDLWINPLFYYADELERTGTVVNYSTTFWAPIVPLYYRSDDTATGQSRRIVNLYWSRDREGDLTAAGFAPFVFYRPGDAGYLHIAPFYFRPTQNGDRERLSFSPVHYYHGEKLNGPEERATLWIGPYYRSEDREAETFYGHLAPLYVSWDTPESKFHLTIPAFVQYEDDSRLIHINALGISVSRERLPLPVVSLNQQDEWVIDQDVALLYNLFRFSTRIAVGSDATSRPADSDIQANAGFNTTPELTHNPRSPDRDTARSFWGVESLFGLLAYERADDWRHFRMLPLSWLSWDARSDDRVYVIPAGFLSYASADVEYFALFPALVPVYGRQRDGESFVESYLALGYLREYDAESQTSEHSVLWPLSNFYASPDRHGGRVLPLFWYRSEHDRDQTQAPEFTAIAPLFYYHASGPANTHWFAPLYYATTSVISHSDSIDLAVADDEPRNTTTVDHTTDNFTFIAVPGVYYSSRITRDSAGEQTNPGDYTLHVPGYMQSREIITAYTSSTVAEVTDTSYNVLYGMFRQTYSAKSPERARGVVAAVADPGSASDEITHRETLALWGFVSNASDQNESTVWVLPLYYGNETQFDTGHSLTRISPLFYFTQDQWDEDPVQTTLVLPPLLTYWNSDGDQNSTIFAPGFYRESYGESAHTNLLGVIDWKNSAARGLYRAWLFPVAGWRAPTEGDAGYTYVAPIYYEHEQRSNRSDTALHLLPLFWSWHTTEAILAQSDDTESRETQYDGTFFLAGLYVRHTPSFHRENFLYLYDREYEREARGHNLQLALGAFEVDTRPRSTRVSLGYSLLADLKVEPETFSTNLLWMRHETNQTEQSWHNSFWPVWWLESTPEETFWVTTPLLSMGNRDANGGYQLIGAGALWHNFYRTEQNESSSRILLGTVYEELRRPERGYHSRGSMWGFLWQYQAESETDYRKFSVLKFLYSRTETEGQVRHRVFGVKVAGT